MTIPTHSEMEGREEEPVLTGGQCGDIVELLQCHALLHRLPRLLSRLTDPELPRPSTPSPSRQLATFLAFCRTVQARGPLPFIKHSKVLHALQWGVGELLHTQRRLLATFTKPRATKLLLALRSLLLRAAIGDKEFLHQELEVLLSRMFPVLPESQANRGAWARLAAILDLQVDQPDCQDLKLVARLNNINRKHMAERLAGREAELAKSASQSDKSSMTLYTVISRDLTEFCSLAVELLLPGSWLARLVASEDPNLALLTRNLPQQPGEKQLLQFLDTVQSCYRDSVVEVEFWSSQVVRRNMNSRF